ncbi:MAG TPA: DUF1549 domain-containing protein [Thermoanaerobaculia bacterium]|jgi:hypothetical protein
MRRKVLALLLAVGLAIPATADRRRAVEKPATAAAASDDEFLRRVTLDLTGQIPDAATVVAFLDDPSPGKRQKKIDELLVSEAFVDRWTLWFGDLVQNVQISNNAREYYIGRNAYYTWIRTSFAANKPYDAMVRELLSGRGDSFESGVANYVVRQIQLNGPPQDTLDNLAAHSAEKFLGLPALCVSCHDGFAHLEQVNTYLAKKKRMDFWRMAAFFSKTAARPQPANLPENPNVRKFDVRDNPRGAYLLNTTDGNKSPRQPFPGDSNVVEPAFLLTGETPRAGEDWRDAYGRMLTADRQFARATVNLLWKELFGRGFVEPVNSFDLTKLATQPSDPALLESLTDSFIAGRYDLRAVLRTMTTSDAYARSRRDRRLPAEMLLDAIAKATGVPFRFNVQGLGTVERAMLLPDPFEGGRRTPASQFLDNFGRGDRDDVARSNDSSVIQALALMNDTIVTQRVRRNTAGSAVGRVLAKTSDPAAIVDELYLVTLSRRPTAEERSFATGYLRGGNLAARTEDLQYALINTSEFLFY